MIAISKTTSYIGILPFLLQIGYNLIYQSFSFLPSFLYMKSFIFVQLKTCASLPDELKIKTFSPFSLQLDIFLQALCNNITRFHHQWAMFPSCNPQHFPSQQPEFPRSVLQNHKSIFLGITEVGNDYLESSVIFQSISQAHFKILQPKICPKLC